ncbi:SLC13 family permease [Oceanobacillus damuensis]|uniref:SLC13 family permease n=1 Tax=Oceanobacillus damuensis TaxID=937928 RepID=UPI0008358A6C|nr:DASS family sodium-coupled anion symporter [Oceanobacillus damuensis]
MYRRKKLKKLISNQMVIMLCATILLISIIYFLPEQVSWGARTTIGIMMFGLILWAFVPIPIGMTSLLVLVLLILLQSVEMEVALSGFASPAVLLIIAGMMIATGVNQTNLMDRLTYRLLSKWGKSAKGIFLSLFSLMQVQAFFIPSTAVRTSLMMPLVSSALDAVGAKKETNFSKLLLLSTAFGGNVSGVAILTAAVGNILTVEILRLYLGTTLTYVQWFIYALPIWLLLMLVVPIILWKLFPPESFSFNMLQKEMDENLQKIGPYTIEDKKCLGILGFTILIWVTEPFHGYHPTFGALLAVVLMTMPGIGFVQWKKMIDVNFDMVLLIGATLSLGFALIESGAIDLLEVLVTPDFVLEVFSNPWLAIPMAVIVSQIYHLGVTNVSTAVVTIMPVLISLSQQAGLDPVVISFAASVTILLGYILIVETMSNVVVYSSGKISQRDFLLPGIYSTIASTVITILVAFTWWRWLGFWP